MKRAILEPHEDLVACIALVSSPLFRLDHGRVLVQVPRICVGMDLVAQEGAVAECGAGVSGICCQLA